MVKKNILILSLLMVFPSIANAQQLKEGYILNQNIKYFDNNNNTHKVGSILSSDFFGIPNGVPNLDADGNINFPLIGDSSKSIIKNNQSTIYKTSKLTLSVPGKDYSIGDKIIIDSDNSIIAVTSVDSNGSITGFNITLNGTSNTPTNGIVSTSKLYSSTTNKGVGAAFTISSSVENNSSLKTLTDFLSNSNSLSTLSGVKLDGSVQSYDYIQTARDSNISNTYFIGNGDMLPEKNNTIIPIINKQRNAGSFYFSTNTLHHGWWDVLGGIADQGDVTVQPWNGSLNFTRNYNDMAGTNPFVYMNLVNQSPNITEWHFSDIGGMYAKTPAMSVHNHNHGHAVGSATGINVSVYDDSDNANCEYSCQDQALDVSAVKAGPASTWGLSISMTDTTHKLPGSFAQTGIENDMGANGPDSGNPLWSPQDGSRKLMWIGIGSQDSAYSYSLPINGDQDNFTTYKSWSASTAYSVGDVLKVVASDGKYHLYEILTAGTSGSTKPSFATSGNTVDGTAVWKYDYPYSAGFSKGIFFDGNNYNKNSFSFYYTGLTSNANFANAFIDTTQINFIDPDKSFVVDGNGNPIYVASTTAAAIRIAPEQKIDLSGENNPNGQNNHILFYTKDAPNFGVPNNSDTWGGLVYEHSGVPYFSIDDLQRTIISGITTIASGSSGDSGASYNGNRYFPQYGLTIIRNQDGNQSVDFVNSASGFQFWQADPSKLESDGRAQSNTLSKLMDVSFNRIQNFKPVSYMNVDTNSLSKITPNIGMYVYNTDINKLVHYNGVNWIDDDNIIVDVSKTYIGNTSSENLTSTGSTISDSLLLQSKTNVITTSTDKSGVRLPNVSINTEIKIINRGTSSIMIYPFDGNSQIENLGNGVGQILISNSSITLIKTSDTEWRFM